MVFDKAELQQLEVLFEKQRIQLIDKMDEQRSATLADTTSLLDEKLRPIKDDLDYLKQQIKVVQKMAVEDVEQAFGKIEILKKKVKQIDRRLAALEH